MPLHALFFISYNDNNCPGPCVWQVGGTVPLLLFFGLFYNIFWSYESWNTGGSFRAQFNLSHLNHIFFSSRGPPITLKTTKGYIYNMYYFRECSTLKTTPHTDNRNGINGFYLYMLLSSSHMGELPWRVTSSGWRQKKDWEKDAILFHLKIFKAKLKFKKYSCFSKEVEQPHQ